MSTQPIDLPPDQIIASYQAPQESHAAIPAGSDRKTAVSKGRTGLSAHSNPDSLTRAPALNREIAASLAVTQESNTDIIGFPFTERLLVP
jgi:hypothetical protein